MPAFPSVECDTTPGGPRSRSSPPRRRNPMACLICRRRKIKCEFNNRPDVCDHCGTKATKCTVLSVAQEEALKIIGYTDEQLASMPNDELELILRHLPPQQHSSAEHTESHPISSDRVYQHYEQPSSPHHPPLSTGQDQGGNLYRTYDPGNRVAPLPYNNSAHDHHPASRTGSTNTANVPINTPHSLAHAHHQYSDYTTYTSSSPIRQTSFQIPATGSASIPRHPISDHHQMQQLHANIPVHRNAVQSQDHANYSGQADYPFQTAQQPSQGQTAQSYQYSSYTAAMGPGYTTHDGSWRR